MASRVYSVPTPTVGQWNRLQIAPDSSAIVFKNDSRFDFLVVFNGTLAPNFTTSAGGQANAFVNALEYPTIWIQAPGASLDERRLNAVGAFDGNIWYLAQDNTTGLAQAGTFSNRVVITIVAYGALDAVPASGLAVARQTDLTNQPRTVALPMAVTLPFRATVTTPANANSATPAGLITLGALTIGIPASNTVVNAYVYRLDVTPLVWGTAQGRLFLWECDAGNAPLAGGSVIIVPWAISSAGRNGPVLATCLSYPNPITFKSSVIATTASVQLFYTLDAGDGGMSVLFDGSVSVDTRNFNPPGPYGTYASGTPGDLY